MGTPRLLLGAEGARKLVGFLAGTEPATVIGRGSTALRLRRGDQAHVTVLQRHVLTWRDEPLLPCRPEEPVFPPHTLLVTDGSVDQIPDGTTVLRVTRDGWRLGDRLVPADDEDALEAVGHRHVRVLARLESVAGWLAPDRSPAALLRLHDACFLAAKTATSPVSYHVVLSGGAGEDGRPHPYAGLFTGLVKALAVEPLFADVDCRVLLSSAGIAGAVAELAQECRGDHALPSAVRAGGRRLVEWAEANPLDLGLARPALTDGAVVVGAGASRGIGMATLLGLATRYRPEIHVLGANDLDRYPHEALVEDEEAHRARRHRELLSGRAVAEVNAELRRLGHAREVHANLLRLREICGSDRVRYHVCDMTDAAAVARAGAALADRPVDLLLNFAGINRSAELDTKLLKDFRAVRDLKVLAYRNLKAAFTPRRWVNAGSVAGLFGLRGETDYAAANDFLFTAAVHGSDETTFGWGLWGGVGRSAEPLVGSVLEDSDLARMPVDEGLTHFVADLGQEQPAVNLAYFSDFEKAAVCRRRPEYAGVWTHRQSFFLDEIVERTRERLVAHRELTLDRDGYLEDHLIQGHPTMPGLVTAEVAVQAAVALVPGKVPVACEDMVFERFIRVYRTARRPERKKIVAELVRDSVSESRVRVRILTDVVAPDGTVLATDRMHASMVVILRPNRPDCPEPRQLPVVVDGVPVANPYRDSPFAKLSGIFAGSPVVTAGATANEAPMKLAGDRLATWFADALTPAILCDALAQSMAVSAEGPWSEVVVPRSVGRIDFYGGHTDHTLAEEELTLRTTSGVDGRGTWGGVFTADGRLVTRMLDVSGDVIGHVHRETGEFRPAEERNIAPAPDWVDETPTVRPQLTTFDENDFRRPVHRWIAEPVPAPPVAHVTHGGSLLLLGHDEPLVRAVAERLRLHYDAVHHASTPAQVTELSAVAWDGIVDLNITGTPEYRLGDTTWRAALATSTAALHLVYERWLADPDTDRHHYLTIGHGDGLFGRSGDTVPQPLAGVWAGLAKNLAVELPGMNIKSVDLDRADPDAVAVAVLAEVGAWDSQEIGYRDGRRHRLAARLAPLPSKDHVPVGPDDLVLISGGGRGVGFELAKALAGHGAEVVVTGREPLPATTLDDTAFARWRRERLIAGVPNRIAAAQAEVRRADLARTVRKNVDGVPRIRYVACDITDRRQVDALVAGLDRPPTVLVHNAAVYRGTRFVNYDVDEVLRTVDVRITGFANLLAAVPTPRFVSCAASISGAVGGMVGHTAYAAGSDGLARLGLWAAARHDLPVHTVCWPTWDRTGNIVNHRGAALYSSAVSPEEGVAHWLAELGERGESRYFGQLGTVARPHHLRTLPWPVDSPDWRRIATNRHFLGEVRKFTEHRRFVTRHHWSPGQEPHLRAGSLTVPMLLEYALAAGDWVRPEGYPSQHLVDVTDLNVWTAGLRLTDGLTLDIAATGEWAGELWQVRIAVGNPDMNTTGPVATMVIRYGAEPPVLGRTSTDSVAVPAHADADLWCTTPMPTASLPHPALTAILAQAGPATQLILSRLVTLPGCRAADAIHLGPGERHASAAGTVVLRVNGLNTGR